MACCPCLTRSDPSKVETLPKGWKTAEVTFYRNWKTAQQQRYRRMEIIDPKGTRYVHEGMGVTALKCFELLIGIPIFLGLNIFWHAFRTPLAALVAPLVSVIKLIRNPTWIQAGELIKDLLWNIPLFFLQGMWNIVRAPFYAIAMEFAALYGIFKPIEGRALVAQIERDWHRLSRRQCIAKEKEVDGLLFLKIFGDKDYHSTFYIAYCMQPFGQLSDEHIDRERTRFLEPGSEIPSDLDPSKIQRAQEIPYCP